MKKRVSTRISQAAAATAAGRRAAAMLDPPRYGIELADRPLPFRDQIQRSFGEHDLSGVRAHTDPRAAGALGADAFTVGEHVVLGGAPSLDLVAHEAAHVIQQRHGADVRGGLGREGDGHERQADAIAAHVVRGESAAHLMPPPTASAPRPALQRKIRKPGTAQVVSAANVQVDTYSSPSEALAGLLVHFPFLLRFVTASEDAMTSVKAALEAAHTATEDRELAEIASQVTPNLLVGEDHTQAAGRDFLIENLPALWKAGVRTLVIELPNEEGMGTVIRGLAEEMYPKDETRVGEVKAAIEDSDNNDKVINALAANARFHPLLAEYLRRAQAIGGGSGHSASFAATIIVAKLRGFEIVCGDVTGEYLPNMTSETSLMKRDASFAKTIADLSKTGRRSITLIGANHLSGQKRKPKDTVPGQLAALNVAAWSVTPG